MKERGVILEEGAEIVVLQPEKLRELRDSA